MKTIKILSISNSFGVNLQTYTHQIGLENDVDIEIYVLYIGGCSLERHATNIKENRKDYELFINGNNTHVMVSILEALKMQNWDYIITQQASQFSGKYETYHPFIDELYKYIKENASFNKFGLQETWEYGQNIIYKELFEGYDNDCEKMYSQIKSTVDKIANEFSADIIVNSGDMIHLAKKEFKENLYDDADFHLSLVGCYIIGANLVKLLTGNKLTKSYYLDNNQIPNNVCDKCIEFVNKH